MTADRKQQLTLFTGIFLLLGSAVSARADYFFSFNSPGLTEALGNQSNNIAIYMDNAIGGTCATLHNCVSVTPGVAVDQTYNGDGHVVGPGNGSVSLTLGNTDGATASNSNSVLNGSKDNFLSNTDDGHNQLSQEIQIKFINGFTLNGSISFDFEIFPDASGTALNPPDFTFQAWNGAVNLADVTKVGVVPGSAPIGSTVSPNSGSRGTETSPQLIGNWQAGSFSNVTELDFIDWPATIGIDNLKLTSTPEPAAVLLLGTLIAGLFMFIHKRKKLTV